MLFGKCILLLPIFIFCIAHAPSNYLVFSQVNSTGSFDFRVVGPTIFGASPACPQASETRFAWLAFHQTGFVLFSYNFYVLSTNLPLFPSAGTIFAFSPCKIRTFSVVRRRFASQCLTVSTHRLVSLPLLFLRRLRASLEHFHLFHFVFRRLFRSFFFFTASVFEGVCSLIPSCKQFLQSYHGNLASDLFLPVYLYSCRAICASMFRFSIKEKNASHKSSKIGVYSLVMFKPSMRLRPNPLGLSAPH
jgi:hypothetical protein